MPRLWRSARTRPSTPCPVALLTPRWWAHRILDLVSSTQDQTQRTRRDDRTQRAETDDRATVLCVCLCCVGAYNLEVERVRHAVTMKSRHYDKADAFQPGPGKCKRERTNERTGRASERRERERERQLVLCSRPLLLCSSTGAYNHEAGQTIGSNAPKVSMHKKLGDYTYASSTNPPFLAQR